MTDGYEIIKVISEIDEGGTQSTTTLVKLEKTRIGRYFDKGGFAEVDYVLVHSAHLEKTDKDGTFTYEETAVLASDHTGAQDHAYLYLVPRKLELWEAMYGIGAVATATAADRNVKGEASGTEI